MLTDFENVSHFRNTTPSSSFSNVNTGRELYVAERVFVILGLIG